MDWTLVALSQMLLITIGVSVALGLRIRGTIKQNEELREHAQVVTDEITKLEENQNPDPKEWVAEKVAALDDDNPHAPIIQIVLEHSAKRNRKFAKELEAAVNLCGFGAPASEEGAESQGPAVSDDQSEDLKQLLQQFTKDSREMMGCIQTLEKENADLRAQLGLPEEAAEQSPASSDESVEGSAEERAAGDTNASATEAGDADADAQEEDISAAEEPTPAESEPQAETASETEAEAEASPASEPEPEPEPENDSTLEPTSAANEAEEPPMLDEEVAELVENFGEEDATEPNAEAKPATTEEVVDQVDPESEAESESESESADAESKEQQTAA